MSAAADPAGDLCRRRRPGPAGRASPVVVVIWIDLQLLGQTKSFEEVTFLSDVPRRLLAVALTGGLRRDELKALSGPDAVNTAFDDGVLIRDESRARERLIVRTLGSRRATAGRGEAEGGGDRGA